MECHPHSYGLGLSAIRAAAARDALVLDNLAIKVVLGLEDAAKEHPAVHAGVGALEASVVRFYGMVLTFVQPLLYTTLEVNAGGADGADPPTEKRAGPQPGQASRHGRHGPGYAQPTRAG